MADILTAIKTVITEVITWVTSTISGMNGIFYDATTKEFSFVGTLLLVGFGLAVVWVAINFIKKLVKRG